MVCLWRSHDNPVASVLTCYIYTGQTQASGLAGKHLYLLSGLANAHCIVLYVLEFTNAYCIVLYVLEFTSFGYTEDKEPVLMQGKL